MSNLVFLSASQLAIAIRKRQVVALGVLEAIWAKLLSTTQFPDFCLVYHCCFNAISPRD